MHRQAVLFETTVMYHQEPHALIFFLFRLCILSSFYPPLLTINVLVAIDLFMNHQAQPIYCCKSYPGPIVVHLLDVSCWTKPKKVIETLNDLITRTGNEKKDNN